jgi:hypothetical protein
MISESDAAAMLEALRKDTQAMESDPAQTAAREKEIAERAEMNTREFLRRTPVEDMHHA